MADAGGKNELQPSFSLHQNKKNIENRITA